MKFMSAREFRVNVGQMRRDLERDEEVVLTANGRPLAIVSSVCPDVFDLELKAIRSARAKVALERIRASAEQAGTQDLSPSEIDSVIAEVRQSEGRK